MKRVLTENSVKATVIDINWERIFTRLEVKVEGEDTSDLVFYTVDEDGLAKARFKQKVLDNGNYLLTLNITNQGENRCIAAGNYWIVACKDGRALGVFVWWKKKSFFDYFLYFGGRRYIAIPNACFTSSKNWIWCTY